MQECREPSLVLCPGEASGKAPCQHPQPVVSRAMISYSLHMHVGTVQNLAHKRPTFTPLTPLFTPGSRRLRARELSQADLHGLDFKGSDREDSKAETTVEVALGGPPCTAAGDDAHMQACACIADASCGLPGLCRQI